jgi:hypothetical protein
VAVAVLVGQAQVRMVALVNQALSLDLQFGLLLEAVAVVMAQVMAPAGQVLAAMVITKIAALMATTAMLRLPILALVVAVVLAAAQELKLVVLVVVVLQ